jgi:hypothetical protein
MSMRVTNKTNFKAVENKVRAAIGLFADTAAKKMEGEAKNNASWTDRTSNARNSIRGEFGWKGNKAVIILSGNMEYSPYLELANEKKYAILVPTIQRNAPEVLKAYKKVVG